MNPLRCAVCRSVVCKEDLPRALALTHSSLDRLESEVASVPAGDDDRDVKHVRYWLSGDATPGLIVGSRDADS